MHKFILRILPFLLLPACENSPKCRFRPEPIFAAGLPHVVEYTFEKQHAQSFERLVLDTNVLLEINQEVCNQTRQEYRFTVPGDFSAFPDSMWLKEAVRQLVFLSTFSARQAPLKAWADVLEAQRPGMRLGEEKEVQPGARIRVDRIVSPEQSTLLLVLSQ